MPVFTLVMVTVAPGIAAALSSCTIPAMVPPVWASRIAPERTIANTAIQPRLWTMPCLLTGLDRNAERRESNYTRRRIYVKEGSPFKQLKRLSAYSSLCLTRGGLMSSRREFLKRVTRATTGMWMVGGVADSALAMMQQTTAPRPKRREVSVGGRRVTTIGVHAHMTFPDIGRYSRRITWFPTTPNIWRVHT